MVYQKIVTLPHMPEHSGKPVFLVSECIKRENVLHMADEPGKR